MILCLFEPNDDNELVSELKSSSLAHVSGLRALLVVTAGRTWIMPFCPCVDPLDRNSSPVENFSWEEQFKKTV
jgi:hypothetical protein